LLAAALLDLMTVTSPMSMPEVPSRAATAAALLDLEASQAVNAIAAPLDHETVTSSLPGPDETSHADDIATVLVYGK
jgi:hypothetical protein